MVGLIRFVFCLITLWLVGDLCLVLGVVFDLLLVLVNCVLFAVVLMVLIAAFVVVLLGLF